MTGASPARVGYPAPPMLGGILLGLGASTSWALANVAVQAASRAAGPFRGLLWAQVLGLGMILPGALLFDGPRAAPTGETAFWIAAAGVSGLLAYVSLFFAFERGRLTIAVPVMSSWAVLAAGLSLLLFDQPVTGAQLAGAAAVIAGALVVSRNAHKETRAEGPGGRGWLLAAFGAAVGFGLLIPSMGRLVPVFGAVGVVGAVYLADIVLGLPLALAFRIPLGPPAGRAWLPVFLAGLFETAGFVCITVASRFAPLALVSPLSSLAAPLTVIYAWLVLRERPTRPLLLGAALVSAGVVVLAL